MLELDIEAAWLACTNGELAERETFSTLTISAGVERVPLTEVEDTIARTVRPHIFVPANLVAEWLLVNWWRLRWEGQRSRPSLDWRRAHCFAAIGSGYAWPDLEVSSDGEFIQIRATAEGTPDAAGVRYLRDATIDIPAAHFEAAVDHFVDTVAGRLATCAPSACTIAELRAELRDERSKPTLAQACKWQALAGIDSGEAPDGWLDHAKAFADDVGDVATEEVLAVLPTLNALAAARKTFDAMRGSTTTVDLRWTEAPALRAASRSAGVSWRRGVAAAQRVRASRSLPSGPVSDAALEDLLSAKLPLTGEVWKGDVTATGGFRNAVTGGRTAVLVTSRLATSQRFHLARLMGCAIVSDGGEHFLPVTKGQTALQKFERAFAQELLCPWTDLDAFSDEHGMDEDGVAAAAEHFKVSEWLVLSTLVNRGKLPRQRLPMG